MFFSIKGEILNDGLSARVYDYAQNGCRTQKNIRSIRVERPMVQMNDK